MKTIKRYTTRNEPFKYAMPNGVDEKGEPLFEDVLFHIHGMDAGTYRDALMLRSENFDYGIFTAGVDSVVGIQTEDELGNVIPVKTPKEFIDAMEKSGLDINLVDALKAVIKRINDLSTIEDEARKN